MDNQQLLRQLDYRKAVRLHCEFVNGGGFGNDIDRSNSREDDEFGGWLEEEWLIMTGLSAIASYHFQAERQNLAEADKHLSAISQSAEVLTNWLEEMSH